MSRRTLPDRRPSITQRVTWGERKFHITIGLDGGRPMEVFYSDGMKEGTDLRNTVQDACVLVSLLLQHGATPRDISKSLSDVTAISAVVGALVDFHPKEET